MADYDAYIDQGEARRKHALEEAIRSSPFEVTTEDVVARAREFEAYLAADPDPGEAGGE